VIKQTKKNQQKQQTKNPNKSTRRDEQTNKKQAKTPGSGSMEFQS
jgi:hypothetical protein